MSKLNQASLPPHQDYFVINHQNYTTRPQPKEQLSLLHKENNTNKTLQNLLAAVELNRTTVVDQQQQQQMRGGQQSIPLTKDHYQSHREFGRDLSNNAHNGSILNAKIINTTTNQGSSNVSIFKNFIQQYQSHSNHTSKNNVINGNNTQANGHLTKLDLNNVNMSSQNYPSSRGNHHSTVIAEEARAQSSQAIKTFDLGSRNQASASTSATGNHSIRDAKIDPLRRKLNNNIAAQANQRRIGGGELIKLGQKLTTEVPRTLEDDKTYNHNSSLIKTQGGSSSMVIPTKNVNIGSIVSRAAAAQQILHQKVSQQHTLGLNSTTNRQINYNTQQQQQQQPSHLQSLQSSQANYKVQAAKLQQQQHLQEDKENKREFSNRQNLPGTVASANNILKRSKTTDPSRAPLRQKESNVQQTQSTAQVITEVPKEDKPNKISQDKLEDVARIMEERRKERMKTLTRNLEVCDLLDIRNPQSVAEFAPAIQRHMNNEELHHLYRDDFLQNQSEVTEKMRAYLIDWLSELHLKFKLWPETLYVCVGIIDKFLQVEDNFKKKDLQCLGITALHIAGKYEEIYPPELKNILKVTDNAVSKDDVLKLEYKILQKLDFNLTFPSILRFMERYARIAQVSEKTQFLAQYLCDTCLLDCTLMKEKPSKLAAVAIYASQKIVKGNSQPVWNATLTKNTNYREDDVRGMAVDLLKFIKNVEQSSLQSLNKKYTSSKFLEVTKLLE